MEATFDDQLTIFDWMPQLKADVDHIKIAKVARDETKPFILGIHYARRMPCVQYAFGLFVDGVLSGVVTYGQPASPTLCRGVAGEENAKNVLELNRLVLLPECNGNNYASILVSHSLKMLPMYTFVVSYADWGGGDTLDMYIRQPTSCTLDAQKKEQIYFQNTDTPAITRRGRQDGKTGLRNTGMCIWLAQNAIGKKCYQS